MKRFFLIRSVAACLLLAGGCGGPPPEPAVVEVPGYESLREQFTGLDMSPLQGRRIVLDPGHGGYFKGAVGPSGLTEAEVNLGVSLYLRGLLEWAGAEVFMTRTADYDFLTPADSTLTSDLAFRVSFADSLQPDVFLSLHHNSVASLDRTVNETQTYYPLADEAASVDLARAIHRHLVLNLEISPAKILPGNFHVLRHATVPAVLGEPAMISHPVIEGRLSLAASQRLEAEAYFLGLLDYFSQGSPRWAGAPVDTLLINEEQVTVQASWIYLQDSLHPEGQSTGRYGPDPGTFQLTLDGKKVPIHVTGQGRFVHWFLADPDLELPAVLELNGRNLAGSALPVRRTVLLPGPARRVSLTLMPESPQQDDGYMGVRWTAPGHFPLPDGRIKFFSKTGSDEILTLPVKGGNSGAALVPVAGGLPTRAEYSVDTAPNSPLLCNMTTAELPGPWRWRFLTNAEGAGVGPWSFRTWLPEGVPVGMADQQLPLIPYEKGRSVWVTMPGMLPLVDPDPANPDTARTVAADHRYWNTETLIPGLRGKIIVLDPAGGGSMTDGTGPLGTRGSSLNLETALLAKGLLEGGGAEVHLTRRGETVIPREEKVRMAGAVGADLFLTIGRADQPGLWTASHHPGSNTGMKWADLFLRHAGGLTAPGDSLAVKPSYNYLLRHTACPAVEVRLPGPETPRREILLSHRGWQRAEARVVLLSIVSLFNQDDREVPTIDVAAIITDLPGAPPVEDVQLVELDGNFIWSPVPARDHPEDLSSHVTGTLDSGGDPPLPALLDRHTLEIRAGAFQQLWLLDKTDSGFDARLMMDNR